MRDSEMFSSQTVIWSVAIMHKMCLFKKNKKRGGRKTETCVCHKIPLGCLFFWHFRATQWAGCVCRTMTPQRRLPPLHHSSKPELSRLLHDFPNFCARLWREWKLVLCRFEGSPLTDGLVRHSNCHRTTPMQRRRTRRRENGNAVWTGSFSKTWNATCGKKKKKEEVLFCLLSHALVWFWHTASLKCPEAAFLLPQDSSPTFSSLFSRKRGH